MSKPPIATPPATPSPEARLIRGIALLEAAKGLLVLLAATGLLTLVHHDVAAMAYTLVEHAHLNPASRYPRIFIDAAERLDDPTLRWLALGAAVYAAVRLVEAYGLLRERAWAEWLAAGSGALYLPVEALEWWRHPSGLRVLLFAVNLAVVAVMLRALWHRRRRG